MKKYFLFFGILLSTNVFALPTCSDSVPVGSGCRFNCPMGGDSCGCGTKTGPNTNTLRLCPEDGGSSFRASPTPLNDQGNPIQKRRK